jgi:hypothetical protein
VRDLKDSTAIVPINLILRAIWKYPHHDDANHTFRLRARVLLCTLDHT